MSKRGFTRRRLLQGSAVGTAFVGAGAFFGPWKHNRAYAQGEADRDRPHHATRAASTATRARTIGAAS